MPNSQKKIAMLAGNGDGVTEHIQVLRVKKLKCCGIIRIAAIHNLRENQAEFGSDSHIDPSRTHLNVILRGAGTAAEVATMALNLMQQADVLPLRKGAVVGLEILFSLPPDSGIAERDYFAACTDWSEAFFEIPILSAAIHNDEAAPHCHVILLPLFNGRMIGSGLVGNRVRLLAIQSDFHVKVGQSYGLVRQAPVKRYSASARLAAAASVVNSLRNSKQSLNDPAICDALRDCLSQAMPVELMDRLGLALPEVKTVKPQTFADIWTKNKPERKMKKPIGNVIDIKPIGNIPTITPEIIQTLSCVGFPDSPPIIQPDNPSIPDDCDDGYIRERDNEQAAGYWDEDRGEFIRRPSTSKSRSAYGVIHRLEQHQR